MGLKTGKRLNLCVTKIITGLALLLFISAYAFSQGTSDDYEEDNNFRQARVININDPTAQHHNFHDLNDEDWVKFYGISDKAYLIEVKVDHLGSQCDILIELYDIAGIISETPLKSDYAIGGDNGSLFLKKCPQDAIYYVRLSNLTPDILGTDARYDLKVRIPDAPDLTGDIVGYVRNSYSGKVITDGHIKAIGKEKEETMSAISYLGSEYDYYIWHPSFASLHFHFIKTIFTL